MPTRDLLSTVLHTLAAAALAGCVATLPSHVRAEGNSPEVDVPSEDGPILGVLEQDPEKYWQRAQQDLFKGIELSETQRAQVDAILEGAARDRNEFNELLAAAAQAREDGDPQRSQELAKQAAAIRNRFRPEIRIDEMGEVLDASQREIFDRNRRLRGDRIFAERRAKKKKSPQRP